MEKSIFALGFFDGVHIGHGALLERTKALAAELGAKPAVISFDVPPVKSVSLISSPYDRRQDILRFYGIPDVYFLHFNDELRHMPWQDFIDLLINDFGAGGLVAGYDFRFGYKGAGNAQLLSQRCSQMGIPCAVCSKVTVGGETVSSTAIRRALEAGDVEMANLYLGHSYSVSGFVQTGLRIGRGLGFPTVNISYEDNVLIPRHGVYVTTVEIEGGESCSAVTNIGVRPTVGGRDRVTVESNLFGFSGSLYGRRIRVNFHKFLRPEIRFSSTEELRQHMAQDRRNAENFFSVHK